MNDCFEPKIKITKDLIFDYCDLVREIDPNCEFTLRDILKIAVSSKIPVNILKQILRCNYIEDYWKEAESKNFEKDNDELYGKIECLELFMEGDIEEREIRETYNGWGFHGVGHKDGKKENYALEFSPMYKLADYPIKISDKILVITTGKSKEDKYFWDSKEYDFRPVITLIELLYSIFWELSFFGSIENREKRKNEIMKDCEKITNKEDKLDDITFSQEEVREIIKKKMENKET